MTTSKDRYIEVLGQERRRRWSVEEKLAMVRESLEPGQSVSVVARRNGINPNQLFHWRKLYQDGSLSAGQCRRGRGTRLGAGRCLEADPRTAPNGRITLNPHLVKAPRDCIDYVILHELCHIAEHNHSERFYRLMQQVMPQWETVKARLDGMAAALLNDTVIPSF